MRSEFRIVFYFVALILSANSARVAGASWLPLCPNFTACATTNQAFLGDGKALISSSAGNAGPSSWVDLKTLDSTQTSMRNVALQLQSGRYLSITMTGGTIYDETGQALYGFSHSGLGPDAAGFNYVTLGPAITFGGTPSPTIITGVGRGAGLPVIYQLQDEGRSWIAQQANINMWSDRLNTGIAEIRRNFIPGPDGQDVWVVPGPITPGLWRTPLRSTLSEPLDFSHLVRVDDGSFPTDVFQVRGWPSDLGLAGGFMAALSTDGMYKSTDFGRSWSRAAFVGTVDDIDFPIVQPSEFPNALAADVQVIAARGSVFITSDRGQTWRPFARGLPYDKYSVTRYGSIVVVAGAGGAFVCQNLDCDGNGFGKVQSLGSSFARAVEFYNPLLDHYFITADEAEKQFVRSGGAGSSWVETGDSFWAWSPEWREEAAYVCRFYGDAVHGPNSHFFSASSNECRGLMTLEDVGAKDRPRWVMEGYAFKAALPSDAGGCAAGLVPIYRAYNNGFALGLNSNHRYVSRRELLAPLVAKGWIEEGIAFCTPSPAI